jgi:hypothetical protein
LRYFRQFIIIQTFIHCIITYSVVVDSRRRHTAVSIWSIIIEDITMKKHSSTRSS